MLNDFSINVVLPSQVEHDIFDKAFDGHIIGIFLL